MPRDKYLELRGEWNILELGMNSGKGQKRSETTRGEEQKDGRDESRQMSQKSDSEERSAERHVALCSGTGATKGK